MAKVKDVLQALDDLTNGRCLKGPGDWATGKNPWVVMKSSSIPGKGVVETPGLVFGDPEMEVKKIAVAMTMTESVIELAAATGVNAIVTHHPIIFDPLRAVEKDSPVWTAARLGVSVISCHTPFDKGDGGTNDVICGLLNLSAVSKIDGDIMRLGSLSRTQGVSELARLVSDVLDADVSFTLGENEISKIAVCTGAAGDEYPAAKAEGADCLLTGEAKYHELLDAAAQGFPILRAGHFATEHPAMSVLRDALDGAFPTVQFRLCAPPRLCGIVTR